MKYHKIFIAIISSILAFNLQAADLYCGLDKVDLELVQKEDQTGVDYRKLLIENGCGVQAKSCFTGRDSEAYKLLETLNNHLFNKYESSIKFVGARYKTFNRKNILLHYVQNKEFKTNYVNKCNFVKLDSFQPIYRAFRNDPEKAGSPGYNGEIEMAILFEDQSLTIEHFQQWYNEFGGAEEGLFLDQNGQCVYELQGEQSNCSVNFNSESKTVKLTIYM